MKFHGVILFSNICVVKSDKLAPLVSLFIYNVFNALFYFLFFRK